MADSFLKHDIGFDVTKKNKSKNDLEHNKNNTEIRYYLVA